MATTTTQLQQLILARIQQAGRMTFAEYMRMALYEPGYGYYVNGESHVGWQGDFYTSTDVADFFAHCMGRQLQSMWEKLGRPEPFTVLEQGAGRGDLAHGVQNWARQEAPELARALTYHTADIKSGQDALQAERLQALAPTVIISNELVDAFPVHIVEKHGAQLYELYVVEQEGRLGVLLDEPSSPEVANYLDSYKIPWRSFEDGWRAEINLDALTWMARTAQLLTTPVACPTRRGKRHGYILAIDYGEKARELYSRYRHYGTLACYYQHQLVEQPLARPGRQDITAHVNFSALINEGRRHGLHLSGYTTQREWLKAYGIDEELTRIRARDFAIIDTERSSDRGQAALLQWYNLRQRAAALTDPAGMGNFKVLILRH
ncbi:class I SAM-dependent methyltransferase [Ktedonosporobacter rubrisoli]|nr:SAM-dependent methyltransferase [Ktedonosporobacter rubrisoli]